MLRPGVVLVAAAVSVSLACDGPGEIWKAATRNSRYRTALDAGIRDVEAEITRLEAGRSTIGTSPDGPPHHRVMGLLASLSHVSMGSPRWANPKDAIDQELSALRDYLRELERERAELAGDVTPRRRRCPVHGEWMFREVVATAGSEAPGMNTVEGRFALWKFPYHGLGRPYGPRQLLPYTRPWICRACRKAHAHWRPLIAQHVGGNAWPIDNDHILIEAVIAIETHRNLCRPALQYEPIETPFHLAVTFQAMPDGSLSAPEFVGSEHALETELTTCLRRVVELGELRQRPAEPVTIVHLPVWREL